MTDQTVFVVDDDHAVAKSVVALLQAVELTARSFSSAEEFLENYGEEPGCIVLDLRLQGMNGLELLKHLRQKSIMIPIVMISGHADADISRQALRQGAAAFLQKPFKGAELIEAVRSCLSSPETEAN